MERTRKIGNTQKVGILGFDYIEFYVSNALQASHFYRSGFGFELLAASGLETGVRDRTTYVLELADIRLMFTTALSPETAIADHVHLHGDSIKDIAFTVSDAELCFETAMKNGARPVQPPTRAEDEHGYTIKATIGACGDTVHSLVQRESYHGAFLPGYREVSNKIGKRAGDLVAIDHVAISVEKGTLSEWVEFYERALGFRQSHQEAVATDWSAMNSKVVQNSIGNVSLPIIEPAISKRKSQIDEYLSFHRGPGAQHIALLSNDITKTVSVLRANGIEFLTTPNSYYDALSARVGGLDEEMESIRELNILADRETNGYLLQVFTKPLQGRPTVFVEVIQRRGALGFGGGNIKALFEAVEREQAGRGNL
jgi:4-hydroxyphenylpyruvate dioxygenase